MSANLDHSEVFWGKRLGLAREFRGLTQTELGENPSDETLLNTRLIPDPRKVKLRVYQTNSTHKSMSALRQGSMILVKDVDFKVFAGPANDPKCPTRELRDLYQTHIRLRALALAEKCLQQKQTNWCHWDFG